MPDDKNARTIGGGATFRIASAIDESHGALGFPAAVALTRLVREHGGGPVPTKGRRAPFDRGVVQTLARAGLVILVGESWVRPDVELNSVGDYRPTPEADPRWTVTSRITGAKEKTAWFAAASTEGLELVAEHGEPTLADTVQPVPAPIGGEHNSGRRVPVADPFGIFDQSLFGSADHLDGPHDVPVEIEDQDEDGDPEGDPDGDADDEDADDEPQLGDLEHLLPDLFNIWASGSEADWAGFAWGALTRAGLTECQDDVDRTLIVCRLGVLAALNREFAARAHDEGTPGDWLYYVNDLVGEVPRINEVSLGRLAERLGVGDAGSIGCELESPTDLVHELIQHEWRAVSRALIDDLGRSVLFTSLWITPSWDAEYPPSDETVWDAVNTDVTHDKLDGWAWIEDGMPG